MKVGGQGQAPTGLSPGKKHCTCLQEDGWAPGHIWKVPGNFTPAGFEPQNFQSVASLYCDDAIPAAKFY
jgi:hypothetical protein